MRGGNRWIFVINTDYIEAPLYGIRQAPEIFARHAHPFAPLLVVHRRFGWLHFTGTSGLHSMKHSTSPSQPVR
jgi:hypothetical protein